jgi:poly(3-hydroxybutyrate) depolymerase
MRSLLGGIACLALTVLRAPGALAQADDAGTLRYQNFDRHYVLHKGTHEVAPVPVVVALHGLNETLEALRGSWTMDAAPGPWMLWLTGRVSMFYTPKLQIG